MSEKKLLSKNSVFNYLKELRIAYKEYIHNPAFTIEDLKVSPGKLDNSPFIKNLIYVDKKKTYYYLIALEDTKINKDFWKTINTTSNNVRFTNEEQLHEVLSTKKGSVNPFSLCNDSDKLIKKVYLDQKINNLSYLSFHPMDNSSTIEIDKNSFLNFLTNIGISYSYHNFEETAPQESKITKTEEKNEKGETKLKIEFKKTENFSEWYSQVIIKAELIEYYDVSGCYILRPNSYFIWESIQSYLDKKFKGQGVKNVYFPMFVRAKNLESEKEHVEGFSAEVAWVTHYGKSKLNEPVAIRPTSETIMYPTYSKWVKSHRDLPILLNQWTNVVRWEFKHPTPFIRTREFLWQEGHTAHKNKEENDSMVHKMIDIYEECYKDLLAIPTIKGVKSINEKFAGAEYTTTCETFIAENGRAIQACTSHSLGQNFSKIFNIVYEDENKEKNFAWQSSWVFTTRSIGIITMIHSDDQGLILPYKVAHIQVVIVPIFVKEKLRSEIIDFCKRVESELIEAGVRVYFDNRDSYTSGFKFNDWEMKGIPLRIEIGPSEVQEKIFKTVRRVDSIKTSFSIDKITENVNNELGKYHDIMYDKAYKKLHENIIIAKNWTEFMSSLNKGKVLKTPWCEDQTCEDKVKEKSAIESRQASNEDKTLSGSAKTLCIPFKQDTLGCDDVCFHCGKKASKYVIWGRSY